MDSRSTADSLDTGLLCLTILARLHHLPAEIKQLEHEFGSSDRAADTSTILRAAKWLGLKASSVSSNWQTLTDTPLPCIALLDDGTYVLVGGIKDDRILINDPRTGAAETQSRDEFESSWTGELILATRRAGLAAAFRKFDFSWFIPFILKYRKYLGDVLIASFFLQVFALITPLFFQVVVDKVLVHRGLTTLDILAIGLLVVSVFEVVLGGLRTYVFAHTTNRIDVALGADLFKHLLRLPVAYFETRRVGDTVARVRELETIRNFITGSSITLVVDLFFTIVFSRCCICTVRCSR